MFRQTFLGAIAALMLLSGCAPSYGTITTRSTVSDNYREDEKGYAGVWMNYTQTRRNVQTEIQGNPFKMDQEVFNLVTAQILTAQQSGQRMHFLPKVFLRDLPGQAPREEYRFVIVFNPIVAVTGQELCAGAKVPTIASTNGRMAVRTAFCRNQQFLNGSTSESGNIDSVRDRGFNRTVSHLLTGMFPLKPRNMAKGDSYDELPYEEANYDFAWGCDRWLACGLNNRLRSPDFH